MNIIVNLFALNILFSTILLITSSNRIHSILYLINIYASTSLIFMYFGLQIIGLFYFIVYIGAIAMLFLFSVMILDIKIELKTFNFIDQILLLFSIFYLLLSLIEDSLYSFFYLNEFEYNFDVDYILKLIGLILFEYYNMIFFSSGIILLIALIACILLTNKKFGYYIKKTQKSIFNNPLIINKQIYFSH